MSSVINCVAYANGQRMDAIRIDEISEVLKRPGQFVWIGLNEPDEALMAQAQEEFGLHDLAVEDAHRAHQRPKIEAYDDSLFIVLRTAQVTGKECRVSFGETHFFLGPNFIVTIRHGSTLSYADVRARCERTPQLLAKGPSFALYAVMDSIVDQYVPIVNQLSEELERLEENVFNAKPSRENITQVYQLKRELLEVKRAILPLIEICNRLTRFDLALIPEETRPYFRDVYDHSLRINELVDNTRELLTSVLEVSFSLISITQNDVSKRFAGWAAIIGVPTMVAGIYGMNFSFIPELHWHYGYPVVLLITMVICFVLYRRFKKAGWL